MRQVALLRGINVGGNNKLPMAELKALFVDAGCADVTTYIQSGNVVFDGGRPAKVAALIEARFGFPLILRTAAEMAAVVRAVPFADTDEKMLHVAFLHAAPSAALVRGLDGNRSPGDEFRVIGREIFMRLPNGVGRSKLTNAYFDKALATTSTLRNWRTVVELTRLAAMK